MSWIELIEIEVTTASDGSAAADSLHPVNGELVDIAYVKDGTAPFADTVDFTITAKETGRTLWAQENVTASARVAPRQPVHTTAGVALVFADGGEALVDRIPLAHEHIHVVVANGGDTKKGTFRIAVRT